MVGVQENKNKSCDELWCKIDYYSVMLYKKSINFVLDKLNLFNSFDIGNFLQIPMETCFNGTTHFVWNINGIKIMLNAKDYLTTDNVLLFDVPYSSIRLDISGTGLDYLRSELIQLNLDTVFTYSDFWGEYGKDFKVTRCDFAFDFVNSIHSDFLNNLLKFVQDRERSGILTRRDARLKHGHKGGLTYTYRCGADEKTMYLGSKNGDKMLRIYDKYLESTDVNGIFKKTDVRFKSIDIKNWLRLELQCREKTANVYLFSCNNDIRNMLSIIFDNFLIRDDNNNPLPFFLDFYDISSLPKVQLNSYFIQLAKPIKQQLEDFILKYWKSLHLSFSYFGVDFIVNLLNDLMISYSSSDCDTDKRKLLSYNTAKALFIEQEKLSLNDFKFIDFEKQSLYNCDILKNVSS